MTLAKKKNYKRYNQIQDKKKKRKIFKTGDENIHSYNSFVDSLQICAST